MIDIRWDESLIKKYSELNEKHRLKNIEYVYDEYAHRRIMFPVETNETIYNAINVGKPYMVARFGDTEINTMNYFLSNNKKLKNPFQLRSVLNQIKFNAGFFSANIRECERFTKMMLDDCRDVDLLAEWNRPMEEWYLDAMMPNSKITHLTFLEPWRMGMMGEALSRSWTQALKGKKVLVVHPFEHSIREQYKKRQHIFERAEVEGILPDFDLITLKAHQTIAKNKTNFKSWFDALDDMCEKCTLLDFDIAIIGCGAYGFPVAAHIKRMGKVAIHFGGATQLLFGIMGNRWEKDSVLSEIVNEYWVRPSKEERPRNSEGVEGACYW